MNPGIYQGIAAIGFAPHMLLPPATKEIVADAESGSAWTSITPRRVSRTDSNRITPGNIGNTIGIVEPPSPILIGNIGTAPPCGLSVIQEVGNKRQYTYPGLVRQSKKLEAFVDGKLSDDQDSTSISAR